MEKYKLIVQIGKIKECLEQGKVQEAVSIAEGLDTRKIKSLSDFGVIAECYFQNHQYDKAREWFLRIYDKNPSRRVLAQIVHLSIKLADVREAEKYLEEFIKAAPEDFYQYIFRYSIDKLNKAPLAKLIEDLECLKKIEYIESWAYELAKLYHKAGLKDRCVAECNDIILWFGNGEYVERAKTLKAYYLGELDSSIFGEDKQESAKEIQHNEETLQEEEPIGNEQDSSSEAETSVVEETIETIPESEEIIEDTVPSTGQENQTEDTDELEEDITQAVAHVVDDLFDQIELESTMETEKEEEAAEEEAEPEPVKKESQEEETESEPVKKENQEEEADQQSQTEQAQQKDEVEEEIYRLLKEENSSEDGKEEEEQENKARENKVEESKIEESKPKETKPENHKKNILDLKKKVEIELLSNEQMLDESQEDLLDRLAQNDINLSQEFGNFIRMEQVRKQIVRSLDQAITQKSSNVNIILTGDDNSGKTDLAKCISKVLYHMKRIGSSKVALIDGERLNNISLLQKKNQLADCVLVIEHAGKMSKDTVKMLLELNQQLQGHLAMILEASREHMNRLLQANSTLSGAFNNRIHLNRYLIQDYMGFAYDYIQQNDYEIETEAFEALQEAFSIFLKFKKGNALAELYTCLDSGMQKSEQRSKKALIAMTQSGHFGDNELMVLKKEDLNFKF